MGWTSRSAGDQDFFPGQDTRWHLPEYYHLPKVPDLHLPISEIDVEPIGKCESGRLVNQRLEFRFPPFHAGQHFLNLFFSSSVSATAILKLSLF